MTRKAEQKRPVCVGTHYVELLCLPKNKVFLANKGGLAFSSYARRTQENNLLGTKVDGLPPSISSTPTVSESIHARGSILENAAQQAAHGTKRRSTVGRVIDLNLKFPSPDKDKQLAGQVSFSRLISERQAKAKAFLIKENTHKKEQLGKRELSFRTSRLLKPEVERTHPFKNKRGPLMTKRNKRLNFFFRAVRSLSSQLFSGYKANEMRSRRKRRHMKFFANINKGLLP